VRNAICEPWSNGQTEGQINRLKMLKRTMYGRANVALRRARMRPLSVPPELGMSQPQIISANFLTPSSRINGAALCQRHGNRW
jgi:hypothetical protein